MRRTKNKFSRFRKHRKYRKHSKNNKSLKTKRRKYQKNRRTRKAGHFGKLRNLGKIASDLSKNPNFRKFGKEAGEHIYSKTAEELIKLSKQQ